VDRNPWVDVAVAFGRASSARARPAIPPVAACHPIVTPHGPRRVDDQIAIAAFSKLAAGAGMKLASMQPVADLAIESSPSEAHGNSFFSSLEEQTGSRVYG